MTFENIPISEELKTLFIEILEVTCDMYLRQRFSYVGLKTSEQFSSSPSGRDGVMETLPVRKRIEGYFHHADFSDPDISRKIWKLVLNAIARIDMHSKSDLPARIQSTFRKHGFQVENGRLVPVSTLSAQS